MLCDRFLVCTDVPRTTFVSNDPVGFTFSVEIMFWLALVGKEVAVGPCRACGSLQCSFIHSCLPCSFGHVIAAPKAQDLSAFYCFKLPG